MSEFPFAEQRYDSQTEVVAFIARVVYPNDSQFGARDRVRKRIENHAQRRFLSCRYQQNGTWMLETEAFFFWACEQVAWQALRSIKGMPQRPLVAHIKDNKIGQLSGVPSAVKIPPDDNIEAAYLALAHENITLKEENAKLRKIIEKRQAQTAKARSKRRK